MITSAKVRELLTYDPDTGAFAWRLPTVYQVAHGIMPGDPAGKVRYDGRVAIKVLGRWYQANRLAWLYMTGTWPTRLVDHKDRDHANNRWSNLRLATVSQNNCNRKSRSTKGLPKGVRQVPYGYQAFITFDKKTEYLGFFKDPAEAGVAYVTRAKVLHGEFFCA